MTDAALLGFFGVVLITGVLLSQAAGRRRAQTALVAFALTFPRGLDAPAVVQTLSGFTGLLRPWWRRWHASTFVALEVHTNPNGLAHYLLVSEPWADIALDVVQSGLPSARLERVPLPETVVNIAAEYRLTAQQRTLGGDPGSVSARLLTALQPTPGTTVVVQWLISPHPPTSPITRSTVGGFGKTSATAPDAESVASLKKKQALPLFLATGRIGVKAANTEAANHRLRAVEAAWHETRAPGVHLQRRLVSLNRAARRLMARQAPLSAWPATLNAAELALLVGWPIGVAAIPGLSLGGCRQLPASPATPTAGTVLADSTHPAQSGRPLAIDLEARFHHVHLLGPTGSGKSVLAAQMVLSDLAAGLGAVVLDPKGDLIEAILERVPRYRWADIIILDAADTAAAVGLNPLRTATGVRMEVVVENLVGLFKSLWRSSWGPRSEDVLRASLMVLVGAGHMTLCEISVLLTDENFRRRLVGRLDDPAVEGFFFWWEGLSDAERTTIASPLLNKTRAFTMRPAIRALIGQSDPKLDIAEAMRTGKVVLCSLSSGLLGEEAANLLGALIVAEVWNATTARAALPPNQRRPVLCFLDEWQRLLHLPTPMASMLAEARSLRLGLVLAHQHADQLGDEVRHAVFANARSRVVFRLGAADARLVAREMGLLTPDDLQGLGAYEVACQLYAAGATQPPATGKTRPLGPATTDVDALRQASRERYGVARADVERSIRQRQTTPEQGSLGRRAKPRTAS